MSGLVAQHPRRRPASRVNGGRVVVGYDGSLGAMAALAWAHGEAVRRRSTLMVLCAAGAGGPAPGIGRRIAEDGAARARLLRPAAGDSSGGTAGDVDVGVTAKTCLHGAATALVEASRIADLVVVGNRGHGVMVGTLLGSVALSVTAQSDCPVVVVRPDARDAAQATDPDTMVPAPGPGRRVVVGVDGSAEADLAVAFAAVRAQQAGAGLLILAAWRTPHLVDGGFDALADYRILTDVAQRAARDAVAAGVHMAQVSLDRAGDAEVTADTEVIEVTEVTEVTGSVVEDSPKRALVRASAGAGLVVVGARGQGAVTGRLLGSVSHALVHDAGCPVAVVRHRR